jgi:regulator of sirC expression with transglutaminase-like and TPR domain
VQIGPYEIEHEIGRGGMGVVYRARSPEGRVVALKVLLEADQAASARFDRERRLLASLDDREGFVGFLDAGRFPRGAWLAMPFVPGGTLRQRLTRGALGVSETVALGVALARALGAAHARGIVHRDVKPENVLFAEDGRPLVADLGLAKHFDRSAPGGSQSMSLSQQGAFKGTAGYMAPEQISDARSVGPPADVFALGAVLYECLGGRPAFPGDSAVEVLARLNSGLIEPLRAPDLPSWLERVVTRALETDPRARFQDGAALERALREGGSRRRLPRALPLALGLGAGALVLGAILVHSHPLTAPASPVAHVVSATATGASTAEARALSARSRALGAKKDYLQAMADATKAIELDPRLAEAWANRAYARGMDGDRDGELADATKAIELDPGLAYGWYCRGAARGIAHDLEGALADTEKALELDPKLAGAWCNHGAARFERHDVEGALEDYGKALEIDPKLETALCNRGLIREKKGDREGALADFERYLEVTTDEAKAATVRKHVEKLRAKLGR